MPKDLTIHIEGHPGHRGNALAHALVDKLRKLLSAMAQAERRFLDKRERQTDYEVVGAGKQNPTHFTLHPVPKAGRYDPMPAFNWTFEQFERIAKGEEVDDRVDATLARTLSDIAHKKREDDYKRLWISVDDIPIELDDGFRLRSDALAIKKDEQEMPPTWFVGTSYGSVVGDLRQVADIEGEHQFVVIPPIGAERITCTFPEEKRELMRTYLFKTVRVIGRLHYSEKSPFPDRVDMIDIEPMSALEQTPHLLDLRGLFKGLDRPDSNLEPLTNGV